MRLFILLVLVGGVVLLVLQNGQFQALMLFGYALPALPVAVWMVGAIAAGILTSTILQLLNYRPKFALRAEPPLASKSPRREGDLPPDAREPIPQRPPERVRDSVRPPQSPTSDWDAPSSPPNQSWDEPLPRTQPSPRKETRPKPPVPPPNPPRARTESVPTDNTVFDANYRVIDPPLSEKPANSANDEDWGFEDDELESEYRQQFRDRDS